LIGVSLLFNRGSQRPWVAVPSLVLSAALIRAPTEVLTALQVVGVGLAVWLGFIRRSGRTLGLLEVATYWLAAGFFGVLTAGIAGFLLNRLYTQVEAVHAFLIAFGANQVAV